MRLYKTLNDKENHSLQIENKKIILTGGFITFPLIEKREK